MSGRRCRSVEGTPAGATGTVLVERDQSDGQVGRGHADQKGDGVFVFSPLHADVHPLRLGAD